MVRASLRFTTLASVLVLAGCAVSTPLPDFNVKRPAASVPSEIAAFSGKWTGTWGGQLPSTLVVEEIQGRQAKLIYSWGSAPAWGVTPGYQRVNGAFGADNVLRASLGGPTVSYKMNALGTLDGRWDSPGRNGADGTFVRAEK